MAERSVKDIVAQGYDAVALRYAELEAENAAWPRMRWLNELLLQLPDGCAVLDLGCGAGVPATRAIATRHAVTGVDISEVQIRLARTNVPQARFVCADATSVDFDDGSFDAVVSFYAVDHIPREEHGALFRRIHKWLRPGGLLLLAIEAGDEPGVVGRWLDAPMFFSFFGPETNLALLREAGFRIVRNAVEPQLEMSREVAYLWVLAQTPEGVSGTSER